MADEQTTESEKKKEDWMNSKWRPMMGWMYMLVCTMDFVGFPVLWSLLQMVSHGNVSSQWQPLTLQGAGLFHIAMGAVIGISAYGRTQEKLGGAAGPTMNFPQGAGTTYTPSAPTTGGFGNGTATAPTTGFTSGSTAFGTSTTGGFGSTSGSFSSASATSGVSGNTGAGATTTGFGTAASAPGQVAIGFGGKPAPIQPEQPQI
jgi:hypothetical protein